MLVFALTSVLAQPAPMKSVHDFTLPSIDGKAVKLSKYKGKVLLIVNTASKCGLTPQYEGLQALYEKHRSAGLVILGFPCNDFRGQEPGTSAEIREFCTAKYNVSFPMFEKVRVLGEEASPLYKFLVSSSDRPNDPIEWNFAKFLVDKQGKVAARFAPKTLPNDASLEAKVAELLKAAR